MCFNEDPGDGLKIQIGEHLIHFWKRKLKILGISRFPKNSRDFDSHLAKKWITCYPIRIVRPGLESSHQSTSDRAVFKCMGKSLLFGFIMGVNWNLFYWRRADFTFWAKPALRLVL